MAAWAALRGFVLFAEATCGYGFRECVSILSWHPFKVLILCISVFQMKEVKSFLAPGV